MQMVGEAPLFHRQFPILLYWGVKHEMLHAVNVN